MNEEKITEQPKSPWVLYSIGRVLDNKLLSEGKITFEKIDHLPNSSGSLIPDIKKMDVTYTDNRGHENTVTTNTSLGDEAYWLPESGWFDTAPDVVRDELVLIYTYGANSETKFWTAMGTTRHLRRKETLRILLSGSDKQGRPTKDNGYMVEISGHTRSIILSTGKENQEKAKWEVSLLGGEGVLSIADRLNENGIEISADATRDRVLAKNAYGNFYQMEKADTKMFVEGDYEEIINGNKSVTVAGNVVYEIGGDQTTGIGGSRNETIGGSWNTTVTADTSFSFTNIDLNGLIWLNGPVGQRNVSPSQAKATFINDMEILGRTKTQDLETDKVPSYNGHTHTCPDGETGEPK